MGEYRVCTVGLEGRLVHYEVIECSSDAEAIAEAQRKLRKHNLELWRDGQLVVRIDSGAVKNAR